VNAFRSSLTAMANPTTYADGLASAQKALNNVKSRLNDVKSALSSSAQPKVDALQSAITAAQNSIDNPKDLTGLVAIVTSGERVASSARGVLDALKAACPSA
jgi:hypothetical protein